jgi:hypothetical protein
MDDNSTVWMPTAHGHQHQQLKGISWKFAKKFSEWWKISEERRKKEYKFSIFCTIDFSNFDSYRTIGSPI